MPGCELSFAYRHPREGHACTHQLAWQSERLESQRPHPVFHAPSECREPIISGRSDGGNHEIKRLNGTVRSSASPRKLIYCVCGYPAIRIDDNDELRRELAEVLEAEIECIAFALPPRVLAFNHLRTSNACHGCCLIHAIIGNHDKPIAWRELSAEILNGRLKADTLVVRGDEHRDSPPRYLCGGPGF